MFTNKNFLRIIIVVVVVVTHHALHKFIAVAKEGIHSLQLNN
jgi:vacuolar-type H+-ATPase subunit I/STV1